MSPSLIQSKQTQNKQVVSLLNDERFVYIISDGCNLFDDQMNFFYLDLTERLAKMVPEKIHQSKKAQILNIFEKLNMSAPAFILQK